VTVGILTVGNFVFGIFMSLHAGLTFIDASHKVWKMRNKAAQKKRGTFRMNCVENIYVTAP
jgi:hypothetical protein